MATPINILLIEDSADDSLLLLRELKKGGYIPLTERIDTSAALQAALEQRQWDVVISDYLMPKFSGLSALDIVKKHDPDLPFIIVSGNIGEDIAVEAMRAGAHDYIIKNNLKRLVPAVERELREAATRRERWRVERDLRASEMQYRLLFENSLDAVVLMTPDGTFISANPAACRILNMTEEEILKTGKYGILDPADMRVQALTEERQRTGTTRGEVTLVRKDGTKITCEISSAQFTDKDGNTRISIVARDITERKMAEQRIDITNSLLKLFTQKYSRPEYLDAACSLIRSWTGNRHVGIRIAKQDGRIPFESCEGYNAAFLAEENNLSLLEDRCICMRVIAGEPLASDLCCMTPAGSFFSNDTGQFVQDLGSQQRPHYRGVCMRHGFKSLAVIPINYRGTAFGAIHIADERPGVMPEKNVLMLEHLAYIIGEAVFRFGIEDDLRENYNRLRSTSELLEKIFSTTHMLVAYLDRNLKFISVNRAYADAERRDPGYFVGKKYFDLCPDEQLRPVFQQVVDTGEPHFEFERPFLYPGSHAGSVSYWDWSLLAVKEVDGSVSGLVLTLVDVTDRLKAEEGLRRANAYNRSLIEASLDPLVTIGPDGHIMDANTATEMATGFLRHELIGTAFTWYFTDPTKAEAGYRMVFREGKVMDYALELRHRDGRVIPVLYNASVYRDTDGMVLGVFAAARDMTELRKAEQERIRLASAVESTADAVVIMEPATGVIQYVNPSFERITGYAKSEALGRPLHVLDGGKHDELFYAELRETLQREGVWRGQLMSRKKDGAAYFEDCTFSPVKNSTGEIINFVAVKRDVTEKLRLESIAESVNTMNNIGYVFSGVRHEIGNPINSAKMSLSVLQRKLDTASKDVVRDYIERAVTEISRVEHLLKSLRNFNLYEKLELERFDLAVFLQKFLNLISEDFGKKHIAIVLQAVPGNLWAAADQRALQQVLLNLMTNAADALGGIPKPEITITAAKRTDRILLRIVDNGCGMTEQQTRDLFKPFYTSKAHGTGLGLVIVKKMLNNMNADITITSVLDRGTTVDIQLPEGINDDART